MRVKSRVQSGGHDVPEDKIRTRYKKALLLIPEMIKICDVLHIYDNTLEPFRIFKKRKNIFFAWSNDFWSIEDIKQLTGIRNYENI